MSLLAAILVGLVALYWLAHIIDLAVVVWKGPHHEP
jgi:hypothetical protein